jgi:hemoglobin/transferrin/lactoferrin receptor protein
MHTPQRFTQLLRQTAMLAVAAVPAFAQEEAEDSFELSPFEVTAEGAQSVLVINQRDLSQRQATDLEDALSLDPSITVGGSTAIAQKIYVRNMGEDLLNISIDGATQVGALFHHTGRIIIEPELLKRVEVQPGMGNATDGPGALGGAIRFVTKDAEDLLDPNQDWGGMLKYGYFSNTDGHKGSATGYGRIGGGWSTLASVVVAEHGNIEDGDGNELAGSGSRQEVALIKLGGDFDNGHSLRLSFEYLDEEGDKLRRPEWAPGPGNPLFPMSASRRTAVLRYGFDPIDQDWLNLHFNASHTSADIFQNGPWGPYEGEIVGVQFDLRNQQQHGDLEVTYGIDHRKDEVFAGDNTDPRALSEEGSVTGLFVQGSYTVSEALTLTAGGRYDDYTLDDSNDQSYDLEGFSPNLGLVYKFTPEWSINASYATAFSGPEMLDAFIIGGASNAPDLEGERGRNYEARLVYANAGLTVEAGAYRNRIKDVITTTIPWVRVYDNAGDLETDGVFARVQYGTRRYNLSLQYNHADTTLDGQVATRYQYGSLVSRIGDTWVLDASWRPLDELNLGWNLRHVEGIDGILIGEDISGVPDSYIDKPSYTTHDLYLSWQPVFADYLTINLTVKNVFDEAYISHGAIENLTSIPGFEAVIGAPEQGRDIRVSATLRF